MNMKKILKINMLVGLVAVAISKPALAVWPVTDAGLITTTTQGFVGTNAQLTTLNGSATSLNTYLMGITTGGNGLVENTTSMNEKLGQLVAKSNNDWTQQNAQLRAAIAQSEMVKKTLSVQPTINACEDASAAGGRGQTAAIAAATKRALTDKGTDKDTKQPDPNAQAASSVMYKVSKNYCTSGDAALNTANCSTAGSLAGADIKASSLMSGAVETNSSTVLSNHTFSDTQLVAANDYINNLLGIAPEQLDSKTNQTAAGRTYSGYANIYNARRGAAREFTDGILADNTPATSTSSDVWTSAGKSSWAETEDEWNSMFPGKAWPGANASSYDRLSFEAEQFYASPIWNTYYQTLDEKGLLSESLKMKAIEMHVQLLQYRNAQQTNLLLSALLAQSLNPLTTDALKQKAQEAYTRQEAN